MSAGERLTTVVSVGARLVVEEVPDGVLLRRAPLFETTQVSDVFAMLKTDGKRRSVEDMDAAVLDEARRRHAGD